MPEILTKAGRNNGPKSRSPWNKTWIGICLGIIFPVIIFLGYYFIRHSNVPLEEFLEYAFMMKALPKILSLCVVPNLIAFYIFLNKEFWKTTRGIIAATLICTIGVLLLKILA